MNKTAIIETNRLTLREQTTKDAEFILALMNDPEWIKYIGDRGVGTVKEARNYILDGAGAMYQQHGFGLYLIELKEDKESIGICGLVKRDSLDDVDLGFALAPVYRGKGYAYEAAKATVNYGRKVVGLKRIAAIASPSNTKSIKLLEKLGFLFEKPISASGGDKVHKFVLTL